MRRGPPAEPTFRLSKALGSTFPLVTRQRLRRAAKNAIALKIFLRVRRYIVC